MIRSKFRTPKKELSIPISTKLTSLITAIKSSISENRKVQVLSQMININVSTIRMLFTTDEFFEVAIERWNPQPLNSVQTL